MKKIAMILLGLVLSSSAFALKNNADPHFFLNISNQTNRSITYTYADRSDESVTLTKRNDSTGQYSCPGTSYIQNVQIPSQSLSDTYGVCMPTDKSSTGKFGIIVTGTHDCEIDLGYFVDGVITFESKGMGCNGVGYTQNGYTVTLNINGINQAPK